MTSKLSRVTNRLLFERYDLNQYLRRKITPHLNKLPTCYPILSLSLLNLLEQNKLLGELCIYIEKYKTRQKAKERDHIYFCYIHTPSIYYSLHKTYIIFTQIAWAPCSTHFGFHFDNQICKARARKFLECMKSFAWIN